MDLPVSLALLEAMPTPPREPDGGGYLRAGRRGGVFHRRSNTRRPSPEGRAARRGPPGLCNER